MGIKRTVSSRRIDLGILYQSQDIPFLKIRKLMTDRTTGRQDGPMSDRYGSFDTHIDTLHDMLCHMAYVIKCHQMTKYVKEL